MTSENEFGPGQTVGGNQSGGPTLSPSEVRRRRLATLDQGSATRTSTRTTTMRKEEEVPDENASNVVHTTPPSSLSHGSFTREHDDDDDDDDAALQAALAMSLEKGDEDDVSSSHPNGASSAVAAPQDTRWNAAAHEDSSSTTVVVEPLDIAAFHNLMWSTQFTTDNDKSRWVHQGMDVRDSNSSSTEEDGKQHTKMVVGGTTASSMLAAVGTDFGPWGLVQAHGGPCGVLAAVQAELLRVLLFGRIGGSDRETSLDYPMFLREDETERSWSPRPELINEGLVRRALAMAIAMIVARAALMPSANESSDEATSTAPDKQARIVLPSVDMTVTYNGLSWQDLVPWTTATMGEGSSHERSTTLQVFTIPSSRIISGQNCNTKRQKMDSGTSPELPQPQLSRDERIVSLAYAITAFLLDSSRLDYFRQPGGVILLVMSLVCSRGASVISNEMDDPMGTKLTAQFGHCGQELINLLLTGQAVSNVFDNTLTPSGDLTCRGVQTRPAVGYLSQLEAMRYCEVGGYYKNPRFPIWVVGSTSHFTVLFGTSAALKESQSDALLERCRRAFKAVEGGEENGFIAKDALGACLQTLDIQVGGDSAVQMLAATLEVSGAGIILWDDFWKAASRLLTGASVENVLNGTTNNTSSNANPQGDPTPLRLTQYGEGGDLKPRAIDKQLLAKPAAETDEEMASRLAAEWGSDGRDTNEALLPRMSPISSSAAAAAQMMSPMEIDRPKLSDEEYARQLQAEWNAEQTGGSASSVAAVNGSPSLSGHGDVDVINVNDMNEDYSDLPDLMPVVHSNPADDDNNEHADLRFGNSIQLYHYNGLRGGTLTPFRVTRMSSEEAVGASIALTQHSAGGASSHTSGGGNGDLEDVIRTKYPSSMINWLGRGPPNID